MPPKHRTGPSYMRGGVLACPKRRHASLVSGPPHGRRCCRQLEGGTNTSGLHGVDAAVGLAWMLLTGVPLGRTNTTRWRGPLVKAHPCKVKGLDPVVKCYRVSRDGALGVAMPPKRRTGPSYMRGGVVACPKRRHASPVRGLPHGRHHRRHLEGGNCRVGSTRSGCSCGFGPDVAPGCPYGPT